MTDVNNNGSGTVTPSGAASTFGADTTSSGFNATDVGGAITNPRDDGGGGGILGVDIEDEGIAIPNNPHTTLNFTGPGIVATDVAGVATITVAGGTIQSVTLANTPYTILPDDDYLFVDSSGGPIVLNLPDPSQFTYAKEYVLIDTQGTFELNNVTLNPFGAEKISGLPSPKIFRTDWGGWKIVTNGVDWFVY